jgi:hypothetical protein
VVQIAPGLMARCLGIPLRCIFVSPPPPPVRYDLHVDVGHAVGGIVGVRLSPARSPHNPQLYFDPFQRHLTFIRAHEHNPRLVYGQGVHVLSQRRTEPASRGILDQATETGLCALDVRRYTTDPKPLRGK